MNAKSCTAKEFCFAILTIYTCTVKEIFFNYTILLSSVETVLVYERFNVCACKKYGLLTYEFNANSKYDMVINENCC